MSVPVNSATTNYYDYTVVYNYYTRTVTIEDASSYVGAGVGSQSYTLTLPSGTVLTGTITPSAPVPLVFNMGYMGASIQVGNYDIVGVFTDADNEEYTLEKETNLCLPKQNSSSTGANGCVTLGWTVRCIDNLIIVADQTPFVLTVNSVVYQATDVTYGITCVNPLGVILANNVDIPSFQITPIVNGGYNININDTATFEVGDNVSVIVHFVLLGTIKQAQCNINLCDVYCAVDAVYRQWLAVQGAGSPQERTLKDKWVQLAFLIGEAQIAITCGNDLDAILAQIEAISGVACACGCGVSNVNQGVNVALGQNIVIQGGDNITVESSTVGNTTTFTVNGYAYDIVSDTLTVTSSTTDNTTTYRLEESGKVKADSTDTAAGYLYNKLESQDGSVVITDDTTGTHQVDLAAVAGGILYQNTTGAYIPNNNTENTMYSYTIPAATGTGTPIKALSNDGDMIRGYLCVQNNLSSNANNRTIRLRLGGTTIWSYAFTSTSQDAYLVELNFEIIRTSATTQIFNFKWSAGVLGTALSIYTLPTTAGSAILTSTNALIATGQNATAASNTVVFDEFWVELVKKI